LPSVILSKAFAECKIVFAECLRHSTKNVIPVVTLISLGPQYIRSIDLNNRLYCYRADEG
jgi:hypothetical protein